MSCIKVCSFEANIDKWIIFLWQTSHTERIDALELLGATFVDKKRDLLGALKYWKRAMGLRYMDSNNIVRKPEPKQLIMAYDYAREVSFFYSSVAKGFGVSYLLVLGFDDGLLKVNLS